MCYNHQFKMLWEKNVYLQPYSAAYNNIGQKVKWSRVPGANNIGRY